MKNVHHQKLAGLLILIIILLTTTTPAQAWDTTVYARNCDPDSGGVGYYLYTFNGNDSLCMSGTGSGTDYISFLETGDYNCNSNGTGNCKVANTASNQWSCSNARTVRSNGTLLIYGSSGKSLQVMTSTSSSANCCATQAGVTDSECEAYFTECKANGISGITCLSSYVPCREAGNTETACTENT
ncbi:MAG: hypothetical protein MI802_15745 [Desulfobacterales bacterium]|nr:hypothetical protein [Desulfobacterales bacterium]